MYQKLKKLRVEHQYTTQYMAEMLGISKPYYYQIENEQRRLSYDMAVKISMVFGKKPDEIFLKETKK